MAISDHAGVIATGVFQIIETSSSLQSARPRVEDYLRDELADAERRVLADRSIAGSST
jgi:hypothetical protein